MRVQLAPQAKESLGTSALVMLTERVDDVALLIGQRVTMGLPEGFDRLQHGCFASRIETRDNSGHS